jgi:hypothetical protein
MDGMTDRQLDTSIAFMEKLRALFEQPHAQERLGQTSVLNKTE